MSPYLFIFSISPFQCVSFFSFKIKKKTRKIIRSEEILDFFLLFFFLLFLCSSYWLFCFSFFVCVLLLLWWWYTPFAVISQSYNGIIRMPWTSVEGSRVPAARLSEPSRWRLGLVTPVSSSSRLFFLSLSCLFLSFSSVHRHVEFLVQFL